MFNHDHARNLLSIALTDARYWQHRAQTHNLSLDSDRYAFWTEQVTVQGLAVDVLEYALDRHYGIASCHPDADCDHEEPGFGGILGRIPSIAGLLTSLRTTKTELAELVAERVLRAIGDTAELDQWERQNA